ncbi:hypothetical protein BUC_7446 [Burkholderia pseudomallei 576]|nr:hypothetical protein BUC_7446 [Burkholderia pseudomallei 576]
MPERAITAASAAAEELLAGGTSFARAAAPRRAARILVSPPAFRARRFPAMPAIVSILHTIAR